MSVDERVNHQPKAYPHHGYTTVLLNFTGVYLTKEKINVPCDKTKHIFFFKNQCSFFTNGFLQCQMYSQKLSHVCCCLPSCQIHITHKLLLSEVKYASHACTVF